MKRIRFLALSLLLLVACKRCEDRVCSALPETYKSWIPFTLGDTVVFSNASGKSFSFRVNREFASGDTIQRCFRSLSNCSCHNCKPYCLVTAKGDSVRGGFSDYSIEVSINTVIRNQRQDTVAKRYEILFLDFTGDFILDVVQNATDSLSQNGIAYSNLLHSRKDTLNPNFKNILISDIYFSKKLGICAFYDRKIHDWFYRTK